MLCVQRSWNPEAVSGSEDLIIRIRRGRYWEGITAAAGCWADRSRAREEGELVEGGTGTTSSWSGGSRARQVSTILEGVGRWECDWHAKKIWSESPTPRSALAVSRPLSPVPLAEASETRASPACLPLAACAAQWPVPPVPEPGKSSSDPKPSSRRSLALKSQSPFSLPSASLCSASRWPPLHHHPSILSPRPLPSDLHLSSSLHLFTSSPLLPSNTAHALEGNIDSSRQATRSYNILSSDPEHRC
jgi:hypothetical protein